MPDFVVDARAVRDELAGEVQVRVPQEVERHHVRIEPHRAHLAAVQRVLVLGPLDHLLHASPDHRVRTGPEDLPLALLVDVHLRDRVLLAQVEAEDLLGGLPVRARDVDDFVERAGSQQRRVHAVRPFRRPDHEDIVQFDESVHLAEDLGDDVLVDAGRVHHAADREEGLDLIEEHDARLLLVRLAENLLDDPLRLPDPLRQDVRDADVEERHVVLRRNRFHEQRLPTPGRAVQEDAARRLEGNLLEQVRLLVREHDDVLDPLDRLREPPDLRVLHVRLLPQEERLDLEVREDIEHLHRRREDANLESGLQLLVDVLVAIDQAFLHIPFDRDDELAVQHVDDFRDDAFVPDRAALDDRVRLRVDPDVLAYAALGLVHEPGRDLQQFRRPRHDHLVSVEVGPLLANDVRVEERRQYDLVELVIV